MELNDIQGLLIRGHKEMPEVTYVMLRIAEAEPARNWIKAWLPRITPGDQKPMDKRVQLAFTYSGIEKLGGHQAVKYGFPVEFVQGMTTEWKSRVLGDLGDSGPDQWEWGGPLQPAIDLVVMVFTPDSESMGLELKILASGLAAGGLVEVIRLTGESNPFQKEHFGFRDGVAQPIIEGLSKKGAAENTLPPGEFILGYENAYFQLPETPVVDARYDPEHHLPALSGSERDFGRNGSYMVFRQLQQDVAGFWENVRAAVQAEDPHNGPEASIQLAAKMVGRWPNGHPVTLSPEKEQPYSKDQDDFLYAEKDAHGFGCPFGSHIRRSNPRDAMPDNKPKSAVKISNRHRILRRGRNFGPPLAPSLDPRELMTTPDDGHKRGLHFICFNANIQRQFEFIQHQWCNNPKFAGQYNDPDPILGIKDARDKSETHSFTIQQSPIRRKVTGLVRHVQVVGGAYFFMPGIRALRFLAHLSIESLK